MQQLGDRLPLILDAGDTGGTLASTIVRIDDDNWSIAREGALPDAEIHKAFRVVADERACARLLQFHRVEKIVVARGAHLDSRHSAPVHADVVDVPQVDIRLVFRHDLLNLRQQSPSAFRGPFPRAGASISASSAGLR